MPAAAQRSVRSCAHGNCVHKAMVVDDGLNLCSDHALQALKARLHVPSRHFGRANGDRERYEMPRKYA